MATTEAYKQGAIAALNQICDDLIEAEVFPRKSTICKLMRDRGYAIGNNHLSYGTAWATELSKISTNAQARAMRKGLRPEGHGRTADLSRSCRHRDLKSIAAIVFKFQRGDHPYRVVSDFQNTENVCSIHRNEDAKFKVQHWNGREWKHHSYLSVKGLQTLKAKVSPADFHECKQQRMSRIAAAAASA